MADTENSYNIGFDWVNLNTLSSINTGDSFYIQNTALAQDIIVLAVSSTEPSIDFKGVNLYQKEVKQVLEGNNATWARLVKIDRDPNEVRTASVNIQSSLPAIGLPVSATQTDGLTDTELRASPVDVTFDNSSIEVSNFPAQQDVNIVNDVTVNKGTGWEIGLTDVELRASDLKVSLDNEIVGVSQSGAWSVEINNQLTDYALASKQLADNHQVTVSNFPTSQTDALTDTELRASRVNVSLIGEVVAAAQSGSWDVSVNNQPTNYSTAVNQLPNNHQVQVSNFPASQSTTVTNEVEVTLNGENVVVNKGTGWVDPQTNAITDSELRANPIEALTINTLVPTAYDDISLGYDASDNLISVIYKSSSVVVATLTLTYTSGLLTQVVKS
jgi:hypothetical protein